MSNIKTTCLRFNLDKPLDKQAWDYLQSMDKEKFKSYSHAIILSVIEYFENQSPDEHEERFIEQIIAAIEKELPKFLAACVAGIMQSHQPDNVVIPTADKENEEAASEIDFDFVGG